jgi:DNA-binding LacI/PurR family transcriptional regulator
MARGWSAPRTPPKGYLLCSPPIINNVEMAARRLRKIDILERDLRPGMTIAQIRELAASLKWMEDRYMVRAAAVLLIERGDPDGAVLQAGLDKRPVLGREPHGDKLRLAFKEAMERDGIPADVEAMARSWYAGRPADAGGPFGGLKKLFRAR